MVDVIKILKVSSLILKSFEDYNLWSEDEGY